MGGDATCTQAHEGPVSARDVLVRDGRVQNAFVYVAEGLGDRVFERPSEPVVIDQKGCLYVPKVLGVQTGQPIRFVNSDATLHNVHTAPENSPGTNFGMAVEGGQRDVRIPKPEVMVRVKCDVHPWMQAWIGVLDHPYFSVTAEDGRFRFEKVPEGAFTVAVWHERFGPLERPARVNAGETTTMEFVYDADGSP